MEPVNRWVPATDEYKTTQVNAEAELKKRLEEAQKNKPVEHIAEKERPVLINVLIWYYLVRAGICVLLLTVISVSPQSSVSIWLSDNMANYLRLPSSRAKQMEVERKQIEAEAEAQGYQITLDQEEEKELQAQEAQEAADYKSMIKVYLALSVVLSVWIAFMWWNRSWKIRWVTMFFAGAFVAKAALNGALGIASSLGIQSTPGQTASLLLMVAINGFIFCYMAFWPGVKDYFEGEK